MLEGQGGIDGHNLEYHKLIPKKHPPDHYVWELGSVVKQLVKNKFRNMPLNKSIGGNF